MTDLYIAFAELRPSGYGTVVISCSNGHVIQKHVSAYHFQTKEGLNSFLEREDLKSVTVYRLTGEMVLEHDGKIEQLK